MSLFLEVSDASLQSEVKTIYTKRLKTILSNPLYELSFFLHPKNRLLKFSNIGITRIFKTLVEYANDWRATPEELDQLQTGATAFKRNESPFNQETLDPILYWNHVEVANTYPDLAQIALQLHAICPHSMACERSFSILGWLHSARRSNMTVSNLEMSAQVYDFLNSQADVKKAASRPDFTFSSSNLPHEVPLEDMTMDEQDATKIIRDAMIETHFSDTDDDTIEEDDIPELMQSLLSIIPLTPDGLKDLIQGTSRVYQEDSPCPAKKQKQGLKKTLLRLID